MLVSFISSRTTIFKGLTTSIIAGPVNLLYRARSGIRPVIVATRRSLYLALGITPRFAKASPGRLLKGIRSTHLWMMIFWFSYPRHRAFIHFRRWLRLLDLRRGCFLGNCFNYACSRLCCRFPLWLPNFLSFRYKNFFFCGLWRDYRIFDSFRNCWQLFLF